jgi:hypothetical protein
MLRMIGDEPRLGANGCTSIHCEETAQSRYAHLGNKHRGGCRPRAAYGEGPATSLRGSADRGGGGGGWGWGGGQTQNRGKWRRVPGPSTLLKHGVNMF